MAKGKNQHFVPKCYLELFSSGEGFVNVFLLEKKQIKKGVPYSSQCQIDYYYGKDLIWETQLGSLESSCAPILKKIDEHEDYYPETSEIAILRQFVVFQHARTTVFNNTTYKQKVQMSAIIASMKLDYERIPYTSEQLAVAINDYFSERVETSRSNLCLADDFKDKIDDLGFILVKCSKALITSDNPVIFINPFTPQNIGLLNIGLLIFFPIGLSTLALFYDRKLYPSLCGQKLIYCNNEDDLNTLNAYQYIFGNKVLIGSIGESFEDFLTPKEEYRKCRTTVQEHDPAIALGDKEHRLIVIDPPSILLEHDLSFCPLLSDAKKIPVCCRESIPRIIDESYIEKIRLKACLYPILMNKQDKLVSKLKRKDYQCGIQHMEYLANKYWNKTLS